VSDEPEDDQPPVIVAAIRCGRKELRITVRGKILDVEEAAPDVPAKPKRRLRLVRALPAATSKT
jgi:hypothetical protein